MKSFKTLIPIAAAIAAATLAFTSCDEATQTTHVTSVSVEPSTLTLKVDDERQLSANVLPETADNLDVTWSVEPQDIASVDADGLVKALKEGEAVITATSVDGGIEGSCELTVEPADAEITPVESVAISGEEAIALTIGDTETLTAQVLPETANQNVSWSSDKPEFVTVDPASGHIEAMAEGVAVITVTTSEGDFKDEVTVTVSPRVYRVTGVSLNQGTMGIYVGDKGTLVATVQPLIATDPTLTWSSEDDEIVKVDAQGHIEGISVGVATITVKTNDGGFEDSCVVTVNAPVVEMTFGFRTDKTWIVSKDDIAQEWSDAVMCSAARDKTSFLGGDTAKGELYADLRENEGYGDLYSWTFVEENADAMCPEGWRVPEVQDFIDLNTALGGTGLYMGMDLGMEMDAEVVAKYTDAAVWGGESGGRAKAADGALDQLGALGIYWTMTEVDGSPDNAHCLQIGMGMASFKATGAKGYGSVVRCVR
ncbi:MAG: Ig-like domain-containing protein [Alistipes sp.]|jgi:uncharacterized protein (TIGR02145 family)|nr:Ig-like domain-containing protein [Alistipes sp.]